MLFWARKTWMWHWKPKPANITDAVWNAKDKKPREVIMLAVLRSITFQITSETTALGMMTALSDTNEKPSPANKVFLIRELFMSRMREGGNVTEHVNLNSILTRLVSVGIKYDDETRACLLLSSLPDSWSGYVTAVTNSVGTEAMTYEKMREGVLGEDVRCRNTVEPSSSFELVHAGRGNNRSSRRLGVGGVVGVMGGARPELAQLFVVGIVEIRGM